MATKQRQPPELFRLKPAKAAAVSEISEATASSPVPPEERVNFHIGNPVQDERLVWAFFRLALGLGASPAAPELPTLESALQETGGLPGDQERLEFLLRLIRRSAPYTPRGGFQRNAPHPLALAFRRWVEKEQPDPLSYDLGEQTGLREVIFDSGGIAETFRVFLHTLSTFLVHLPARLFLFNLTLPPHLSGFGQIAIESLPPDEQEALEAFHAALLAAPERPAFLAIGSILREESRRRLRQLTLDQPFFIIEANDAPNNASLSREAHLSQRVLRFLTPGIFRPELSSLPTVIIAGNADIIHSLEVTHFQIKGTPSAPEIEMLAQMVERGGGVPERPDSDGGPEAIEPAAESLSIGSRFTNPLASHTLPIAARVMQATERLGGRLDALFEAVGARYEARVEMFLRRAEHRLPVIDPFAGTGFSGLYDQLLEHGMDPAWQSALQEAFLSAFLAHHPEYERASARVASGSSRTALGLLGFHCGIREVVIQDLSWTYEHCFPKVHAVPPGEQLQLNVDGLTRAVEERLLQDPHWCEYGAVALNNPHNATGQAYQEQEVLRLLQWLLERNVIVIDDLAYQGVAPAPALSRLRTLRQLTDELVRNGHLTAEQGRRLVTVHSVSKTDSLAGSRLAVVEIRDPALRETFTAVNDTITPNVGAIFLSYLFYRGSVDAVRAYWTLRNVIFEERMSAIQAAAANLPSERNRYGITIRRPAGSMYPLMLIAHLPPGISLDWLSSGLARQGIGLLPLSAFARTEEGYEAGRKAFRLTLGGTDPAGVLLTKTRRVLIDLNRMLAEESSNYNRKIPRELPPAHLPGREELELRLDTLIHEVLEAADGLAARRKQAEGAWRQHFDDRLACFRQRVRERSRLAGLLLRRARGDGGASLGASLAAELYKDSLRGRQEAFRGRLFDRTVHPTQMYSLQVEIFWDEAVRLLLRGGGFPEGFAPALASALLDEYLGLNVAITSQQEGSELVLDLNALLAAEDALHCTERQDFLPFLSYWGDWDGSTRPSGQGHVLAASVLLENVRRMAALLKALLRAAPSTSIDRRVLEESGRLDRNIRQFRKLLTEITYLTHQLERRYRGVLPLRLTSGMVRRAGIALHLANDPLTTLWQHNDRLERRMLTLRQKRKEGLQYYFGLNKSLRKALHASIPAVLEHLHDPQLAIEAVLYRDLLKRVAITPRIHQRFITAQDQFAIDTTVHNIVEINEIAGASGNPGIILGLQVSMTTSADAIIALDRKLRAEREGALRSARQAEIAPVWLIPLFEDLKAVEAIPDHLTKLWDYALQTRRLRQETQERFAEIICEVFIAGSDLSQQIGQTAGATMFREAKRQIVAWLAARGLVGDVRIKMGSGEPMQRQGGY
ncbi:MAG TPA: aminotransferase class I/II-fold pyridoxal phosphate-dependent enzyme, partial [Bacteroidota bacterium]